MMNAVDWSSARSIVAAKDGVYVEHARPDGALGASRAFVPAPVPVLRQKQEAPSPAPTSPKCPPAKLWAFNTKKHDSAAQYITDAAAVDGLRVRLDNGDLEPYPKHSAIVTYPDGKSYLVTLQPMG